MGWSFSVEVTAHNGVVACSLCEETVLLLADLVDACALVQLESFELFGATNLGSHLVLHVLVSLAILNALVLLGETQLFEGFDLLLDAVVLGGRDNFVELTVLSLKKGTVEHVLGLALGKFSLVKDMTLFPKRKNMVRNSVQT